MESFRRALVGLGRGANDAATLHQAAQLGAVLDIPHFNLAHVLRSSELPAELAQPIDQKLLQDEICEYLERLRAAVTWPDGTTFELFVLEGGPGRQLIKLAKQEEVDLVCIGRQRDKPQDTLGLAASRLVQQCHCSVLVAAREQPEAYRSLLVPLDFSPHSIEALEVARSIASACEGGRVTAQFVYSVPPGFDKVGKAFDDFAASLRQHAEVRWREASSLLSETGPQPEVRFDLIPPENWADKPADVIVRTADELDADLIVCGARGHTAVARFFLGSTTEGVLKQTKRATLCVKRKDEHIGLLKAVLGEDW